MTNQRWIPSSLKYPGYNVPVTKIYTLRERIDMANQMSSEELRRHIAYYSDSYTYETVNEIAQAVATMSKPMAEILDDMRIPRVWEGFEFIRLDGPPVKEGDSSPMLMRIVHPRKIAVDEVVVQPLTDPVPLLMSLVMRYPLDITL